MEKLTLMVRLDEQGCSSVTPGLQPWTRDRSSPVSGMVTIASRSKKAKKTESEVFLTRFIRRLEGNRALPMPLCLWEPYKG